MSKTSVQVVYDLDSNQCYVVTDGVKKPTTRHRIHVEFDAGDDFSSHFQMKFDKWPSKKSMENQ